MYLRNVNVHYAVTYFCNRDSGIVLYIKRKDGEIFAPREIEELLETFKKGKPYTEKEWIDFLIENGYEIELLEYVDYVIKV